MHGEPDDIPPFIDEVTFEFVAFDPPRLGTLVFKTEKGEFRFGMSNLVAADIIHELTEFLATDEIKVPDEPPN